MQQPVEQKLRIFLGVILHACPEDHMGVIDEFLCLSHFWMAPAEDTVVPNPLEESSAAKAAANMQSVQALMATPPRQKPQVSKVVRQV